MVIEIGKKSQIHLTPAFLCVGCFPKAIPALVMCNGESLCLNCYKDLPVKEEEKKEGGE